MSKLKFISMKRVFGPTSEMPFGPVGTFIGQVIGYRTKNGEKRPLPWSFQWPAPPTILPSKFLTGPTSESENARKSMA